jgi:6-pyruvoyltetrahydropterin/6-carboxytetrahydropterin synthase
MMPIRLHRTVGFHATHRFFVPEWSAEQNRARFGWTTDEPGHAHQYRCTVTVRPASGQETDRVVDLPVLDRILAEVVVAPLDAKHLNLDLPEFAYGRSLPTCEALARYLFARIAARLPAGVTLARVLVAEDETLAGEYSTD